MTLMTGSINILKCCVEVIVLTAKSQSPKYRPLGFWLQLTSNKIKNKCEKSWPIYACQPWFVWVFILGEETLRNNNGINE